MSSKIIQLSRVFSILILTWFLISCGGGSSSGFVPPNESGNTIRVTITADRTEFPANLNFEEPNVSGPFTNTFIVRVEQISNGSLYPANNITVDLAPGLAQGALYYLDGDPAHDGAFRRMVFENTSGIATGHFWASSTPGTVTITASVIDPVTELSVSASMDFVVISADRPITSLEFTGPFVNAILLGTASFGGADETLFDGSYQRIVSVIANDADGQPVLPFTRINFFLITGPLTGFPEFGAGSFFIAGNNGNPLEGGYNFTAVGGDFVAKGVKRFDRLVLDGVNFGFLPDNRYLTGIRTIQNIVSADQLIIDQSGPPFSNNEPIKLDNGATVPYIVGRAQGATILSTGRTDVTGVADTLMIYPAWQVGQTAILVACSTDNVVCAVLNTCDANGQDCGQVFLPYDGVANILSASLSELPPNSSTPVTFCVSDGFAAPVQGATVGYTVSTGTGSAVVTVNGSTSPSGGFTVGASGCATIIIETIGQAPGTEPITVTFSTSGAAPVVVSISGPGEGDLDGTADCDLAAFFEFVEANQIYEECSMITDVPETTDRLPGECVDAGFTVEQNTVFTIEGPEVSELISTFDACAAEMPPFSTPSCALISGVSGGSLTTFLSEVESQCRAIDPSTETLSAFCQVLGFEVVEDTENLLVKPDRPVAPESVMCTFDMLLSDDRGGPIPDVLVEHVVDPNTALISIVYDPAFGEFGITNASGNVSADTELRIGGEINLTFEAGTADLEFKIDLSIDQMPPP